MCANLILISVYRIVDMFMYVHCTCNILQISTDNMKTVI
jgi:hypothetical protein